MNYPLRSIAFMADLIHPPMRHSTENLQKVHGHVFNDEECAYQNFQIIPGGAQMVNTANRPNVVSCCNILQDRVQIREEMTGIGRDDFRNRALRIAQVAVQDLLIPVFVARQLVVRSLINPKHSEDSRRFLGESIFKMGEKDFEPLDLSPNLLGLRFAFQSASPQDPIYNIRVESYTQDSRSLFLENVATFRKPITVASIDDIGTDFDTVYNYVKNNIVPFVARFDKAAD
jgi:hypothetical protein